jgi:menaquinol-cytochrome c reductase iron-sulfur subunit
MSTNTVTTPSADASLSRRGFFMKLGILFNGCAAIILALPIARFLFSSITRGRENGYLSWVRLGDVGNFPEGETRMATFRNPLVLPTDGKTVDTACWVRRVAGDQFQVFAINCAHLGFLCVPVTAEHTIAMARVRLGHQSVGFSYIRTKSKTVC